MPEENSLSTKRGQIGIEADPELLAGVTPIHAGPHRPRPGQEEGAVPVLLVPTTAICFPVLNILQVVMGARLLRESRE